MTGYALAAGNEPPLIRPVAFTALCQWDCREGIRLGRLFDPPPQGSATGREARGCARGIELRTIYPDVLGETCTKLAWRAEERVRK